MNKQYILRTVSQTLALKIYPKMALPIKGAVWFQALFAFLCVHQSAADLVNLGNVTLDTPVGKVRGNSLLLTDGDRETTSPLYVFLGIPYAKPPVGELRFKPTEQPEPWEGTYDALVMPPACSQYAENPFPWYDTLPGQSEDCLYLNVWTPKDAVTGYIDGDERQKRAVKLYIHGGGWFTGGSSRLGYYEGRGDANEFGVRDTYNKEYIGLVVVTINYRLGALGFLSSGTEDAPGNAGLHDILTAMKWVHSNIASFGGDPDNIALFGQGAGAIAASLFLTVPSSLKFFNKMVLSGATLYTLKALKGVTNEYGDGYDNNIKLADRLAAAVGCDSNIAENPKATVDCLKGVDASSLVQTMASFSPVFQQPPNVFLPQFGRDDIIQVADPFSSIDAIIKYNYTKVVLFVFNGDEGSYLLTVNNPDVFGVFGEIDTGIDDAQAKSMMTKFLENFPQPDDLAEKLLGDLDTKPTVGNRKKVYQVMGHVNTICPIVYLADDLVNGGYTVYVEEKRVDPIYNPWAKWMGFVHFNNVPLDFIRDGPQFKAPWAVNGQSYNPTSDQSQISFFNKVIVARIMYGKLENSVAEFFKKYTPTDRYYSNFSQDASAFDGGKYRDLGGKFCETLKKYFVK
ncbi:hypothetical protein JTE90_006174 [Oedothorax gibbosus]|uniref:Carboxylesterase type B domain-containing protein n=1 Tax=Oedothorax gibbosus TaxID=931172 RepID=A0AAV6TSA1_9ARAC|nr:hypothetical protein JTE90_006174 [Oedothorax gibbosus]